MAYKTLSQVKDSISGILQGLNLNNVKNLNTVLERSVRQLAVLVDIPELVDQSSITLYDGVYDYTAPTNVFGTAIVDLRPQGLNRNDSEYAYKKPTEQFDREKLNGSTGFDITFDYKNGTPILRVNSSIPTPRIELDPMTETTGWTLAGSGSGLTTDKSVLWQSPSSLRFNLTGASAGTLTKTITSFDLTDYQSVGVAFLAFRTPSASNLTSIELRIGSDSSNYYSVTVTSGFLEAFTANEWMLAAFDLSTATTTGSPVITAIDYVDLVITHSATLTNFYVGDLWIALPSPATILFQTSGPFLASGSSTPSNTITANTDTVQFNDNALVIYEHVAARNIALQQGGTVASGLIATIDNILNGYRGYHGILIQPGLLDLYRADNPSQELRTTGSWYD